MAILIKRSGATILTVYPASSSDYTRQLMGAETVTLSWEQASYYALKVGDYITYNGIKHTLNQLPTVKKLSTKLFQYNAVFQAPIYDLLKVNYMLFDNTQTIPSGEFSLTGTPATFMQLLVDNMERIYGAQTWLLGEVLSAEAKTLSFNNESCHAVLTRLATEFKTEYSLSDNAINLIELTTASNLVLEYGSTLYDIERKTVDSSNIITRLYAYGSDKNIAATYRSGSKKLLLAENNGYIESNTSLYGVIEGQQTFDEVYPRLGAGTAGTVTAIGADIFTFTDENLDFDVNDCLMPGTPAKLRFLTGACAGYDLEILQYNHATQTFKVIVNEDDKGFKIPDGALAPAIGNKYVLLDIIMPEAYTEAAESELFAKAQEYLNENSHPKVAYLVTFSALYAKENAPDINPGDLVNVIDTDLGINTDLRITKVTRGITDAHNVKLEISETVSKTTLDRINSEIAENKIGITAANKGVSQSFGRNWRNVQELSGMIETLRADMLLIGKIQGDFSLSQVFFTPNYQNDKNKFHATAGYLIHASLPTAADPETWALPAYSPTLATDATPYFLYAKCSRTAATGVFYVSETSLVFDADPAFYYFLIGGISSVTDGVRTLQTTYGWTQITGKQIATGAIQSRTGQCGFDLDNEEIYGNIKFRSNGSLKTIDDALNAAINGVKVGGTNLLLNSRKHSGDRGAGTVAYNPDLSWNAVDCTSYNLWYQPYAFQAGETYTVSIRCKRVSGSGGNIQSFFDDVNDYLAIPGTDNLSSNYAVYKLTRTLSATAASSNFVSFIFPAGTIQVDYIKIEKGTIATDWSEAPEDTLARINENKSYIDTVKNDLQGQLDGNITSWFYDYLPTLVNEPASLWDTEDKKIAHLKDLFYWTSKGYAYRFMYVNGAYVWGAITDIDVLKALQDAANAQDTADGKRQVFATVPLQSQFYDVGDLWVNATYGVYVNDLLRCTTPKLAGEAFSINHWQKASKYTDDSLFLNMKLGSRNYIKNSNFAKQLTGWGYQNVANVQFLTSDLPIGATSGIKFQSTASNFGGGIWLPWANLAGNLTAGKEYVLSFWAKSNEEYDMLCGQESQQEGRTITGAWNKIVIKFTATSNSPNLSFYAANTGSDYIYMTNFKLTLGNVEDDWTIAPEDVNDEIVSLYFLKDAINPAQSTDVIGGLVAMNVLLMKDFFGGILQARGGMSGIQADNVGYWTGGTYQQAVADAAKAFKSAMSTGSLHKKDGSGHEAFGKFAWDILGKLFVGDQFQKREVNITSEPLESLASYLSLAGASDISINEFTPYAGEIVVDSGGLTVFDISRRIYEDDNTTSQFTLTEESLVVLDISANTYTQGITSSPTVANSYVRVKKITYPNGVKTLTTVIDSTLNALGTSSLKGRYYLAAGTYVLDVYAYCSVNDQTSNPVGSKFGVAISWGSLKYTTLNSKTTIASNGIACIKDEWRYFYMSQAFGEYFVKARGNVEWLNEKGDHGFRLTDTGFVSF